MSETDPRLEAARDFIRGVFARNDQELTDEQVETAARRAAKALPPFTDVSKAKASTQQFKHYARARGD